MAKTITTTAADCTITVDPADRSVRIEKPGHFETYAFLGLGGELDPDDADLLPESDWQACEIAIDDALKAWGVELPSSPPC